jgi:hypothetical protein
MTNNFFFAGVTFEEGQLCSNELVGISETSSYLQRRKVNYRELKKTPRRNPAARYSAPAVAVRGAAFFLALAPRRGPRCSLPPGIAGASRVVAGQSSA